MSKREVLNELQSEEELICREEFMLHLDAQIGHWDKQALSAQLKSLQLSRILAQVERAEDNGLRVQFFIDRENQSLRVEIGAKGVMGFVFPKEGGEKT